MTTSRRRTRVVIAAAVAGLLVTVVALTAAVVPFTSEGLRRRVIATLADRLDADVELRELSVRFYPNLHAVGTALAIRHKGRRDVPPLISVKRFTVDASLLGLWRKHVSHVNLEGLDIEIPPGDHDDGDDNKAPDSSPKRAHTGPLRQVVVDDVVANDSRLVTLPRDPAKNPKVWTMHELHVSSVGAGQAMPFHSILTNGVPPGEIDTTGSFGPWQPDDPGQTPLGGRFTFDHADLGVFHGISGILSAHGTFGGTLDTIDVNGETDTPDFMVKISGHTVPLHTKYHAVVDGTNGDTALKRIDASFLQTSLVAEGGVFDLKGAPGKRVTLKVTMDSARLEDVMRLAVDAPKAPMVGGLRLETTFDLPPGPADVVDKLRLNGQFAIDDGRFTTAEIQQKINGLSRRARGKMKEAPAEPRAVGSNFKGRFALAGGTLRLQRIAFNIPGALVSMSGQYSLKNEAIAFNGTAFLDAKVSQMTTGIKSLLLKAIDPIFERNGRTVIPIKIGGTRSDPSFGLDIRRVLDRSPAT